jgi:hypothetical protein
MGGTLSVPPSLIPPVGNVYKRVRMQWHREAPEFRHDLGVSHSSNCRNGWSTTT